MANITQFSMVAFFFKRQAEVSERTVDAPIPGVLEETFEVVRFAPRKRGARANRRTNCGCARVSRRDCRRGEVGPA